MRTRSIARFRFIPAASAKRSTLALRTVTGETLDDQRWSMLPIIPHPPSWKPRGHFMLSIRSKRSRVMMRARRTSASLHLELKNLVDEARAQRRKVICFVTGVPGAGKTLVGLNVATRRRHGTNHTRGISFRKRPACSCAPRSTHP